MPVTEQKLEQSPAHTHVHKDKKGVLHVCYHKCRTVFTDWGFWIGVTVSFPLEHFLWEQVWPFSWITKLIGL